MVDINPIGSERLSFIATQLFYYMVDINSLGTRRLSFTTTRSSCNATDTNSADVKIYLNHLTDASTKGAEGLLFKHPSYHIRQMQTQQSFKCKAFVTRQCDHLVIRRT